MENVIKLTVGTTKFVLRHSLMENTMGFQCYVKQQKQCTKGTYLKYIRKRYLNTNDYNKARCIMQSYLLRFWNRY